MSASGRWFAGLVPAALLACALGQGAQAGARPNAPSALGADAEGLLAAARQLSPALRAAALETQAASAKAGGADALDDPSITDSYQYYKDPGVFSAHTITLSQSFPLWGKRGLRRRAALADVDASRGREQAAQDDLAEQIKVAYAQYYLTAREIAVNREVATLALRMRRAAAARYAVGGSDQLATIQALGEETTARAEAVRLAGEHAAARVRLATLIGQPADTLLAEPDHARPLPASEPGLADLSERARTANPLLSAGDAAIAAARARDTLAAKARYPDLTIGAGPLIQTNARPVGFAATVGFNIPLPWGREAAGKREAEAQLGASEQRYDAARLEIEGGLGEALARLRAARLSESLWQREAMPQARAGFRGMLANYAQGRAELTAAITAEHQVHDAELRLLQFQLDEQVALAAIERLIGGDL